MEPLNYQPGEILRETLHEIRHILGPSLEDLTVERIVLGVFFTGVKLSNGTGGVCYTPIKSIPNAVCCPSSAKALPSSGKLKGRAALQCAGEMLASGPLSRAIGIAIVNAFSMNCWQARPPVEYGIKIGIDAMDEVTLRDDDYVVVVGAIVPTLKALKRRGKPFGILELDTATLTPDEMPFYIPPERAAEAVAKADWLIVTGTTLINDTLEGLLEQRKPGARVALIGPTASALPGAFFRRGVGIIGGVRVVEPDRVLDIIAEGGSGFHFFDKGADRIVIQQLQGISPRMRFEAADAQRI
jgi:uncharacterized protein (DUF4213/DUF364 family)